MHGYAGKILRVDLSSGRTWNVPTADYVERFVGGRGIATKIYWDEVPPEVGSLDPENRLIIVTGPLGGIPGLSASVWQIHGKSPAGIHEHFCYANLVGHWGAHLKFAGYDGIVIEGKAERPVYLLISDDNVEVRDASHIWGRTTVETREVLKRELGQGAKILATGPAGENLVRFATVLAENDASGGSGFGAVMGSKKLNAVAVCGSGKLSVAMPGKLQELRRGVRELDRDKRWIPMPLYGPVPGVDERQYACYGCISGCDRTVAVTSDGKKSKRFCASGAFYQEHVKAYYGETNDVVIRAGRLCNEYGLDVRQMNASINLLLRCRKAGILTDAMTGISTAKVGSLEFIETLVRKVSLREGFGDVLALGPPGAALAIGNGADRLIPDLVSTYEGQVLMRDPRNYILSGLVHATEVKPARYQLSELGMVMSHWVGWASKVKAGGKLDHDPFTGAASADMKSVEKALDACYLSSDVLRNIARRFWGSEAAADFTTYEGKATAARKIQDRSFAKECLIACFVKWPLTHARYTEGHLGDPTLESRLLTAVTGKDYDEEALNLVGERVFNLQRAILTREGRQGRESDRLPESCFTTPLAHDSLNPDCLVPGKGGEIISRKGAVVDRERFERLKDEYYQLRGWDVATGFQTQAKLEQLGLGDIVAGLGDKVVS